MAILVKLITAQQVIAGCFTNKNTLPSLIKDSLIDATQEQHIRPVLNDLFDVIVEQVRGSTVTVVNQDLLDNYIIPCLAYYVKYEVLPDLSANTTSKGVRVIDDQFTSPASDKTRADLMKQTLGIADALRDKMVRFIEHADNIDDFPDYKKFENVSNTIRRFGGVVIDDYTATATNPEDQR